MQTDGIEKKQIPYTCFIWRFTRRAPKTQKQIILLGFITDYSKGYRAKGRGKIYATAESREVRLGFQELPCPRPHRNECSFSSSNYKVVCGTSLLREAKMSPRVQGFYGVLVT